MEKVILVGRYDPRSDETAFSYSMEELKRLTETAGASVAGVLTQTKEKRDPATYIGSGKLEELYRLCQEWEVDAVIFNDELSPSQQANIAERLQIKVIDRTQLILDIFAGRARSREGRLQVELAQLEYLLPRLSGFGHVMSRLGGGIGTRGPGETQLETDRRHIRRRISEIKKQLEAVTRHRDRYREERRNKQWFQIALVGYTNAGKSTLFNRLTESSAYEENQLFATLDPLTRKFRTPSGYTALMTDTVGFIQHLPTTLIAAFRSTLEEVREAHLLIHVVDWSHPDRQQHMETVDKLLNELGAGTIPQLLLYNKKDKVAHAEAVIVDGLKISAFDAQDIEKVKMAIEKAMIEQSVPYYISVPAKEGSFLSRLYEETIITEKSWHESDRTYGVSGFVWKSSPLYAFLNGREDRHDDQ
ncbi:GTPase HflX [Tuberibacillus calidus]|jgi:GTP-binding protein HflX|uniref:GTPase HflX n=1 Tax=Tuberibacillus calidus TaxID=340097 RepID=UPI000400BFE3|nr:GTPase HflX [Tuberibacillus calidus]